MPSATLRTVSGDDGESGTCASLDELGVARLERREDLELLGALADRAPARAVQLRRRQRVELALDQLLGLADLRAVGLPAELDVLLGERVRQQRREARIGVRGLHRRHVRLALGGDLDLVRDLVGGQVAGKARRAVRAATASSETSSMFVAASRAGSREGSGTSSRTASGRAPGSRNSSDASAVYCFSWSSENAKRRQRARRSGRSARSAAAAAGPRGRSSGRALGLGQGSFGDRPAARSDPERRSLAQRPGLDGSLSAREGPARGRDAAQLHEDRAADGRARRPVLASSSVSSTPASTTTAACRASSSRRWTCRIPTTSSASAPGPTASRPPR